MVAWFAATDEGAVNKGAVIVRWLLDRQSSNIVDAGGRNYPMWPQHHSKMVGCFTPHLFGDGFVLFWSTPEIDGFDPKTPPLLHSRPLSPSLCVPSH